MRCIRPRCFRKPLLGHVLCAKHAAQHSKDIDSWRRSHTTPAPAPPSPSYEPLQSSVASWLDSATTSSDSSSSDSSGTGGDFGGGGASGSW